MGCDKKGRIFHANEKFSTELIILTQQKKKVVIIIIINKNYPKGNQHHFIHLSLDDPSEAQKEEFTFEIEQMKLLGSHKNVVSMVGCCTLEDESFLVIEYVPYGDLLTWLRRGRKKVKKKKTHHNVFSCTEREPPRNFL